MEGIKHSGALSAEEIMIVLPNAERLRKGPVAILECVQEIPCNPCEKACPFGAITVGEDITALPRIDREKCTGCGACLKVCPVAAITGQKKEPHLINQAACIKCGQCLEICKFESVLVQ